MLAFAGSHRGLGKNLFWYAPAENPLALLLNQDVVRVRWSYPWMTRLVCVTEALQGRGYPQSLKAALELQVTDSVLPENDGPIRVEVCDGVARVTPVKNASARVDVGILSAMYTGWLPASDAVRLGRLENATSQEIATIEAMFAGPKPWLGEMF
jgi:predicted acetyltransferase